MLKTFLKVIRMGAFFRKFSRIRFLSMPQYSKNNILNISYTIHIETDMASKALGFQPYKKLNTHNLKVEPLSMCLHSFFIRLSLNATLILTLKITVLCRPLQGCR